MAGIDMMSYSNMVILDNLLDDVVSLLTTATAGS